MQSGQRINGTVIKLTPFGAFVRIDPSGLIGLVRITEISWEPIKHPQDILEVGQTVEAIMLAFDGERQHISLSIKRCPK